LSAQKAVLESVDLSDQRHLAPKALSHGDQRKLEVALLMALDPKVYMFDEPTAGMSVDEVPTVLDLIRSIKTGATAPFSWSSTRWTWCALWPTGSWFSTTALSSRTGSPER
jgi:ABC-type branched-subunit amino acid transport system ATPase component